MFDSNINTETPYLFDIHQHPVTPRYLYLVMNVSAKVELFYNGFLC